MISEVRSSASGQSQHEVIAERMRSLCQQSDYFKQQAQELKRRRALLEEQRQTLQHESQQLDGQILKLQSSLEDATSQCHVLMERTNSLKEKLVVQAKRKKVRSILQYMTAHAILIDCSKDLHYANLWIRTGTACGAVSHIIRLREDLQKLKQQMLNQQIIEHSGSPEELFTVDSRVVCGLQKLAKLTESNLAALAKETAVKQPGRLTYREKQQVQGLLSLKKGENDETKLLQLTLVLCVVNKLDNPQHIEAAFLAERDAFYGTSVSPDCDDSSSSKNDWINEDKSRLSGLTPLSQRRSDASTNVGSPVVSEKSKHVAK